eukprot:TRINITY_DN1019_c0_g1_i2.p1 TRINITY_DN1019_c0_g1~~TRINITY_DN1019_c0_g1_i2.p1  ORF type:complete len:245 (-),score=45.13 TRINITY_DN1019_c0_g1_i2:100-834(-)
MFMWPTALVAVFVLVYLGYTSAQDCTYTNGDSKFDLSPLKRRSGEGDWHMAVEMYNWHINVCGNTEKNEFCTSENSAYYYLWYGTCIIAGTTNNMKWGLIDSNTPATGPSLTYSTSESCMSSVRSVVINFRCKSGVVGQPTQVNNPTGCLTTIEFDTMYGCPKAGGVKGDIEGLSGGSILLIILLVAVVVYLVGGFVVNWKVRHMDPNVQALPNISFWQEIPGLVKDGAAFTYGKLHARLRGGN